MSIVLGNNKDFSDFQVIDKIESNINYYKLILNNDLVLDSDFINNGELAIRGSIIFNGGKLINRGEIYFIEKDIIEYDLPFDLSGDNQFTGLIVDREIKKVVILVTSPFSKTEGWKSVINFDFSEKNPFYFSDDGGVTQKMEIQPGDGLYWNESYSKIKLFKGLRIILQIL